MSGPKHGEYVNYRSEIQQESIILDQHIKEIKDLIQNAEKSLNLENYEKEMVEKHAKQEWEKESQDIKNQISNIKNKLKEIENNKNITAYNSTNLSKIRNLNAQAKQLLEKAKSDYNNFRKIKAQILSKSQERAKQHKEKTERELRELIIPNIEFLQEWAFDDRVKDLINLLENFKNVDYLKVEEERQTILALYDELKEKALKNKKDFEVKKDTSDKVIQTLIDMNYTNIERTLDGGKLGKIIVKADTPDESWNITYEIDTDGKIKVITPNDDRCYINLEDINKKLEDYGIQVDIKELKERKKSKEKVRERQTQKDKQEER